MDGTITKTRFAPSPTGMLHLGSMRTALFNWLLAAHEQGVFVLRIEDTDPDRSTDDYAEALQGDLRWLGLDWGEGPGIFGLHEAYHQSRRGEIYRDYFDLLEQQGLAYYCFCSEQDLQVMRKTQLAAGRAPRYPGVCANLSRDEVVARLNAGRRPTLRFRVPRDETVQFDDLVRGTQRFATDDIGDFIIRRADGTPAFFFCNAVDDSLMGVTHVLRGEDHLTNTPRQLLLLKALGLRAPRYGHISMIVGADGAPLSKRHGSLSVRELALRGYLPDALNNYLARLGHYYEQTHYMDLASLGEHFSVEALGRAPARYDDEQLLHWQREAVNHAADETLWVWMGEAVHGAVPADRRADFIQAVRANVTFPKDAGHWARILFGDELELNAEAEAVLKEAGKDFFSLARYAYELGNGQYSTLTQTLKERSGLKGKKLFMPLRVALSGQTDGPELKHIVGLLPAARIHARLAHAARLAEAAT